MQTGWVNMGDEPDGSFKNFRYFQESGAVQTGWLSTTPPEDDDFDMDLGWDVEWYYFSNTGVPEVGPAIEDAFDQRPGQDQRITYLFNEKGIRCTACGGCRSGAAASTPAISSAPTRRPARSSRAGHREEGDGTKSEFYFTETGSKAGRGYTGVKNNYLYYMGKLQEAENGTRYEALPSTGRIIWSTLPARWSSPARSRIPAEPSTRPIPPA